MILGRVRLSDHDWFYRYGWRQRFLSRFLYRFLSRYPSS